jgi:hypothetical protein
VDQEVFVAKGKGDTGEVRVPGAIITVEAFGLTLNLGASGRNGRLARCPPGIRDLPHSPEYPHQCPSSPWAIRQC